MHYIPESTRAYLEGESSTVGGSQSSFHAASAPLYFLTAIVALLLGGDALIGASGNPEWLPYQKLFGYRLALWAAVLGGANILYHALDGLISGRIGADLALAIACLAAILLGEHSVAALVVLISLCGNSLEGYTVDRAASVLRRTLNLHPDRAHVLRGGGEQDVPVSQLIIGEMVIVRPGERIPVDGTVINGSSSVDQSALTGESRLCDKSAGDSVFSGTVNRFGAMTVEVKAVGEATRLGQIVKVVSAAGASKARWERVADTLARYFLPVVLIVAALTLIGWRIKTGSWREAANPALSVLVVSCPCPLILATPTAVLAALAWLARRGVVIKGSAALERLAEVDVFAFDKTGTLTSGALQLGKVVPRAGLDTTELLLVAAAAEKRSEHLLARLIVKEAEQRNAVVPNPEQFAIEPGLGVRATFRGSALPGFLTKANRSPTTSTMSEIGGNTEDARWQVLVGNPQWLERAGIPLTEQWQSELASLDAAGQGGVIVAVQRVPSDGQSDEPNSAEILGLIGVRDTPRTEASRVLAELKQAGIRQLAMLTGDRLAAAERVAEGLPDLDQVAAEMLPLDKAEWVAAQTTAGGKVAMVGDGVNDAPALATASVGLALATGSNNLAAEAGDILLLHDPLSSLPGLVRLSRKLVQVIRQSIFVFAFGMNALGILLSAFGVFNPVGAALFHELASMAVMLNALRLLWFESASSNRLSLWAESASAWGDSVVQNLSPASLANRLAERWGTVLRLVMSALLLAWCVSNLGIVKSDEQAVVTRCGKFQEELSPGIYFRWPMPFERVQKVRVDQLRNVQIGFRSASGRPATRGEFQTAIEWQSEHNQLDLTPKPDEASALVGDEVAVELAAEAHYRIVDLRQYLFATADADGTVRAALEAALRQVLAEQSLDLILTTGRSQIERAALAQAQQTLKPYALGVELTGLHLLDLHPPVAVVPSYRDVANALEEQEQLINSAETEYARQVLSAAGEEAIRSLSPAEKSDRLISRSTTGQVSDWKLNDATWQRLTRENQGETILSGAAAARLLDARRDALKQVQAARGQSAKFETLLEAYRAQPQLTQFRMYWEQIEKSLAMRPLTIVDPRAASRQHLFLVDPDRFLPPPVPAAIKSPGESQ